MDYAREQGYVIDKPASNWFSVVMRRAEEHLVVATAADGHAIYFNVHDANDHGSLIDFIQRRQPMTLGHVRKVLRARARALAQQRRDPKSDFPWVKRWSKPEPSSVDCQRVLLDWLAMDALQSTHPLLRQQGLSAETLDDLRFASKIRVDSDGHAVFVHEDNAGLVGFEWGNEALTASGQGDTTRLVEHRGQKAFWRSTNLHKAACVVLVESAVDAMSHAQLTGDHQAAYLSIGQRLSNEQAKLLRSVLVLAAGRGARVVLATGFGDAGQTLALQVQALMPPGVTLDRQEPDWGQNWNEQLRWEARQVKKSPKLVSTLKSPGMG